jgi:hypothetical protein
MPKDTGPSLITLTDEENEIFQLVWEHESFRDTCWETYGPEWIDHVPTAINAFTWFYFAIRLLPWQLAVYYAPQREMTIIGGRGSGKTVGLGIAMAAYHTLHPGEPWLHVSPVKDQAQRTFEAIMQHGGIPHSNRPTFVQRFVRDAVVAPFPEIRLRSWDAKDPGNIFRFRPLGNDNIEYLRSMEAGTVTVDEAFRDVESPATYPQLRGCIRGMNRVRLAIRGEDERIRIDNLVQQISAAVDDDARKRLENELNRRVKASGLQRRDAMILYGNVAGWPWVKKRFSQGRTRPDHWFSLKVTSYDNPTLGRQAIKAMEESYGGGELQSVEMDANWPSDVGSKFPGRGLSACLDPNMLSQTESRYSCNEVGYTVRKHLEHGVFLYEEPPITGHQHVIGADPGSGSIPHRNKYAIVVFDISTQPFRMVYFEAGNVGMSGRGSFIPFWSRLRYCRDRYRGLPGDIWIESTGPQRGMAQLAMPEDLRVTQISLVTTKLILTNQHAALIDRGLFRWPDIQMWRDEHANYDLPDDDLDQDCVMAGICASGAIWQYVDIDYATTGLYNDVYADESQEWDSYDRNARPLERPDSHYSGVAENYDLVARLR